MKHMWIRTLALMLALMLSAGNALAAGSLLDGFFDEEDAETPEVESAAAEAEDPGMPFQALDVAYFFDGDYGFSEDRAWVELKDEKRICLINPEGEILYEAPKNVAINAVDDWVNLDRFEPVRNGVAYITAASGETGVSVIIDANGNELARFTGDKTAIRYIAGRTDDRFLLVCIEKSAQGATAYFVPLGLDGKPVDVPRIVGQDEYFVFYDFGSVLDLGDGVFCWNGFDSDLTTSKLYNLNNNTLQQTSEYIRGADWYNDIALLDVKYSSPQGSPMLSMDDLREDRVNLVFTQYSDDWLQGKIMIPGYIPVVYDLNSAEISSSEGLFNLKTSDDGYAVFCDPTETFYSLLGPDGRYLYKGKQLDGHVEDIGRGGYTIMRGDDFYSFYIVDREGVPHLLSDDLSGLPDLSELQFFGFGCGYVLEISSHLGQNGTYEEGRSAFIRSLDGTTLVSGIKRTPDTKALSETFPAEPAPDFSAAMPVGRAGGGKAQTVTTPEEIAAMGETGVIYVDDLFAPEGILLLDTEGITLTYYGDSIEVVNNNPDNKRATLSGGAVFLDGMNLGARLSFPDVTKGGETGRTLFRSLSERDFMNWAAEQATALAELPLIEITIHFGLTIGKDGKYVEYIRTLRRVDYSEELLSPLYGDPIGEYEYEGKAVYRVYRVQPDQNTAIFAIRNLTDDNMFALIAGLSPLCRWIVNGEYYGSEMKLYLPPDGVAIMAIRDLDAIYKEIEVANGTPLDLSLEIVVPGLEAEGTIVLDLGQICN